MPKVSVVIPAYNAMRYLPTTLESLTQQTFTDFEVLIVNDGSSDEIVEWVAGLTDSRVKLISQTNQGAAIARNTGIAHAQGEYVAFLDADDLWMPTKLAKQVQCLDDQPTVGLVHTWMAIINPAGQPTGRIIPSETEGNAWQQMAEKNTVACSSAMVRRCCFDIVGGFLPQPQGCLIGVEDWDMWIRIASQYSFAVIREPLLLYRQHPDNGSNHWQSMERAFHDVIERTFQSSPKELLYLKSRSYGHASLCLAWKVLQSKDKNHQQARFFCQQALQYYPQLRYSMEYLRLRAAIALMRLLGPHGYRKTLDLAFSMRRRLSGITQLQFRQYGSN
jgi:glycosyltransferase involved in cell wall biosynthesis